MRVWHQSYMHLEEMPLYSSRLTRHAAEVVGEGTKVTVHGLPSNAPTATDRFPFVEHVLNGAILDAVIDAERQGYDAVTLGCFYDPALREARSLVEIPVLGLAETSVLAGSFYGRRMGLVSLTKSEALFARELMEVYGLDGRVAVSQSLEPESTEPAIEALGDQWPEALADSLQRAYRACVDEGADVVIPAEGVLNEYLVAARAMGHRPPPFIDAIGLLWKQAEALASQRAALGITTSRIRTLKRPTGPTADELFRLFGTREEVRVNG